MTSEQISALNTMGCCTPTGRFQIRMTDGKMVTLSVMSYDHTTSEGHWNLSYPSYDVNLYSNEDISSYDSNILRYMYNEYMTYYSQLYNRAI